MGRRSGKDMRGRRKRRERRKGRLTERSVEKGEKGEGEEGGGGQSTLQRNWLWPVPYGSPRRVPASWWMCHKNTDAILATCK